MWFDTSEGLSRFDGYKFTNYTTADGLPSNQINDLLEMRDGTYLIGTVNGLGVFNPHSSPMFRTWIPAEPGAEVISVLLEDHRGTIWCGTDSGLYQVEKTQSEWRFHFVDLGLPRVNFDSWLVETLIEDSDGSLWIGTRGSGLCHHWTDGRTERFTTAQGFPADRITALLQDETGRLWAGTTTGLCRLVSAPTPRAKVVANIFTTRDGLTDNWVNTLFESAEGHIFVGGRGFSELTVNGAQMHFRSFTTAQGLSDNNVQAIAEDRYSNLWLGSFNGGVMKIARNGFNTFGKSDGLSNGDISSLFQDRMGRACTFNRDRQRSEFVSCFDGRRFTSVHLNLPHRIQNLGWGWGQEALQDMAGQWWAPTGVGLFGFPSTSSFGQLAHAEPNNFYDSRSGLPTDEVFTLFQDSKGDLWIGSISVALNGLTKWTRSGATLHTFTEEDGLASTNLLPTAFGEDQSGELWIGFHLAGLARYKDGHFTVFTTSDGAPEGWIRAIYCDQRGRLWISGGQNGVKRIDEPQSAHPKFNAYTVAEGLSSNQVNCITEDKWGRLYFGTGRGLDRLNPDTGRIKHYTAADGLVKGRVRYALRDQSGALWFGTESELSRLVPEPEKPEPEPPILIDGLQIAGITTPLSELGESEIGPLSLNSSQNQVRIDFVGLEFDPGEVLRYQHKLDGADRDWSPPSDQRVINYENLAPGSYRFEVRAVTAAGVSSAHPAVVAFTIPPPIWRRWWFVTLALCIVGLLTYTAHHYRLARLLELERVRTRIATDLHDDIGSSLSRMAILSEVVKQRTDDKPTDSVKLLNDIAESARKAVDSMSDIVWAIDPRRDDLGNVVFRVRQFASDLLTAKGIAWQFQAPAEFEKVKLNPEQRRHIFLIFKEAINNSVRHSNCRTVYLSLAVAHHQIVGEIRDDGSGFAFPLLNLGTEYGGTGNGLKNLRSRAEQLGGHLTVASSASGGTHIRLTVPVKKAMA